MSSFVTDTQALVKFMLGKKVINDACHKAFLAADQGKNTIIIPAIVLMEVLYLFEKNRISVDLIQIEELMKSRNYQFEPLSLEILKTASSIDDIPELHDRLIAATAKYLDIPIITNDPLIIKSRHVNILD
ncbi:MAG TPA: PIN domain-containing protein [Deltaproteobacteria bacterium]|nr:PIN domain-containing protein [Deltaproteobacteria bacterium]